MLRSRRHTGAPVADSRPGYSAVALNKMTGDARYVAQVARRCVMTAPIGAAAVGSIAQSRRGGNTATFRTTVPVRTPIPLENVLFSPP
jgi:hypothetical protein